MLLAARAVAGGQEVLGFDHRGGELGRHPAAAHSGEGTARLHAEALGGVVAHALHRVPAVLQRLTERLRVLELRLVDFRGIVGAGEFAELLGRVVLACLDALGHHVKAVGEAPGQVGPELLHPGVPHHVEHRGHHQVDGGGCHVRVGHFELLGGVDDAELGHLGIFGKRGLVEPGVGVVPIGAGVCEESGDVGEVREVGHWGLQGLSLIPSS